MFIVALFYLITCIPLLAIMLLITGIGSVFIINTDIIVVYIYYYATAYLGFLFVALIDIKIEKYFIKKIQPNGVEE